MSTTEFDRTTRVYAWYVSSEGEETHITRRGEDGKWYLMGVDRESEAQFVSLETAADIFALAIQEQRPHGTVEHVPGRERWLEAVAKATGEEPSEEEE